jgi:hypothetical protein
VWTVSYLHSSYRINIDTRKLQKRRIVRLKIAMGKQLLNRRSGLTLSLNILVMLMCTDISFCDRVPYLFLFFAICIIQINYTLINLLVIYVPRVFSCGMKVTTHVICSRGNNQNIYTVGYATTNGAITNSFYQ